jgi:hypothetical protein
MGWNSDQVFTLHISECNNYLPHIQSFFFSLVSRWHEIDILIQHNINSCTLIFKNLNNYALAKYHSYNWWILLFFQMQLSPSQKFSISEIFSIFRLLQIKRIISKNQFSHLSKSLIHNVNVCIDWDKSSPNIEKLSQLLNI